MKTMTSTSKMAASIAITTLLCLTTSEGVWGFIIPPSRSGSNNAVVSFSGSGYRKQPRTTFIGQSDLLSLLSQVGRGDSSSSSSLGPPPPKPGSSNNRNNSNNSRSNGNNNNSNYNNNRNNNNFNQRSRNNVNPSGGRRPGPNVLRLENPLILKRIVVEAPPPQPRREQSDRPPRSSQPGQQQQRQQQPRGGPRQGGPGGARRGAPGAGGGGRPSFGDNKGGGESFDAGYDDDGDDEDDGRGRSRKVKGGRGYASAADTPSIKGPKRQPKQEKTKARKDYDKKRTPLRVTSGRKGNAGRQRRSSLKRRDRSQEKADKFEKMMERKTVVLSDGPMTVGELSESLDEKPATIIKFLMTDLGVMAAISQSLDHATCIAVAEGLGRIVSSEQDDDYDYDDLDITDTALSSGVALDEDDESTLRPRPPVVTIMGHVDHGKTSLLDALRNTKVTATEAGGITQHIAAYQINHDGQPVTFIDTPGHAAFTDMRERGANMTDIVVLVVAADDGVKQQTADSIVCAKQAGVPLVVAINKCDLETKDVMRVKTDLTAYGIIPEDLGGDILCSEISAKENINLDDLLSKIMLQAEMQELKANYDRDAMGIVVEARMEKGLGAVATTLIQRGTLRVGDAFVAGEASGRVRALIADDGTRIDEAGPSTPVSIVGLDQLPAAGDLLVVASDEQTARELSNARQRIAREKQSSSYQSNLMQSVSATFAGGAANKERREMCVVVKADVQGSAEALSRSLSELALENDEAIVVVKVLVAEAGDVTKTDVAIASVTPETTIIAFNTASTMAAMDDARAFGIPIEYYSVVYDAIDSVESRMQEVLSPTPEGEYVGAALVQEVFNIGGTGNIAGSRCTDGFIKKGSNVRVMRGDKILKESKVKTLRNFKAEVDTISEGDECGIGLLDYEDFQPGDVIESYVVATKKK